jgi:hypothetical protein
METSDLRPVNWQLPAALLDALEHQAGTEGLPAEQIATRVLEAGLIELGMMPNGRCSAEQRCQRPHLNRSVIAGA